MTARGSKKPRGFSEVAPKRPGGSIPPHRERTRAKADVPDRPLPNKNSATGRLPAPDCAARSAISAAIGAEIEWSSNGIRGNGPTSNHSRRIGFLGQLRQGIELIG